MNDGIRGLIKEVDSMSKSKIAAEFIDRGYSVVPVNKNKLPTVPWKVFQSRLAKPEELASFDNPAVTGYAMVCGPVSGGISIIDIDEKYSLTGTVFQDYWSNIPDFIQAKVAVQSTMNGGYHIILKSKSMAGNQKLAQRYCTEDELKVKPNEKQLVLIETRGVGGYFLISPSPGYQMMHNKLSDIQELTDAEYEFLIEAARCWNEVVVEAEAPREVTIQNRDHNYSVSIFDDYNNRCDVVSLLEQHGWTMALKRGSKYYMKRPGTENQWSAEWDESKGFFCVFTSSTAFEPGKGYRPYSVYKVLNEIPDWQETAARLKAEGYGIVSEVIKKPNVMSNEPEPEIESDDFLIDWSQNRIDLERFVSGQIPPGLDTGYTDFDQYFRFKRGNLVIISGFDNVGKTTMALWLQFISSVRHGWKWLLYTAENSNLSVMTTLTQFYCMKPIFETTYEERNEAQAFIESHFRLINANELLDYEKLKTKFSGLFNRWKFDGMFIDPWNALDDSKASNTHQFNYMVLTDAKIWGRSNDVAIWINMHCGTGAARMTDDNGYVKVPSKYSIEGGVKNANKADELLIFHRITNHEDEAERLVTEIHVCKVKETLTGGKQTPKDKPFKLIYRNYGAEFRDVNRTQHPFSEEVSKIDFEDLINDAPF